MWTSPFYCKLNYLKMGNKKARDGIRTRDPRLGKAILHH